MRYSLPPPSPSTGALIAAVSAVKGGYHWPGNIRELENVVEHAVITAVDGRLRFNLPSPPASSAVSAGRAGAQIAEVITEERCKERENLVTVLRSCSGRVSGRGGAAEITGAPPNHALFASQTSSNQRKRLS
jgi:transcriptional regulator of acetoin/glycerol metabolism